MKLEESFKVIEETYENTTEEYKCMKWLKEQIENSDCDCLTYGYQMELFYLVIHLLKKNKKLETNRDEVIKELKKFKNNAWSLTFYTKIEEFIEILERGEK